MLAKPSEQNNIEHLLSKFFLLTYDIRMDTQLSPIACFDTKEWEAKRI